jgi:hypothetical protein
MVVIRSRGAYRLNDNPEHQNSTTYDYLYLIIIIIIKAIMFPSSINFFRPIYPSTNTKLSINTISKNTG